MRMKTRNLFALALATMAFTACNNDDDAANGGNNGKGAEIDQIGVSFAPTTTYADNGTMTGTGTENNVYKAFVFAHETNASGLMPGDWSVKEVGDGTNPINATAPSGPSLSNMATFSRVTMGENVYVLVNVPGLTLAQAEVIAHKGANSEQSIKEYVYNVGKDYLNGLAYKNDGAPAGKFVMAGMATIPTNPTTPNGGTVTVPVELNREMAKVHFQALLTADNTKEAYGKVKINQDEDGIVIARISRQISPFTKWEKDWYFPLSASDGDKDWDVAGWATVFNGETNTNPTTAGTAFNGAVSKPAAKEYRYTWVNEPSGKLTIDTDGKLISPYFYVTPNYANDANCVSVICTQATYTGAPVFADENANKLFVGGYSKYISSHESDFKQESGSPATAFKDCKWDDTAMGHVSTYFNNSTQVSTDKSALATLSGLQESEVQGAADIIKAVTQAKVAHTNLSYYTDQKVFYRADIANYDASGAISGNITERNTYYQVEGTITSLGAPTIEGAITSDNISMLVKVKVMPWKWVVNRVDM